MLRKIPDDPGGLLRNKFRYQKIQRYRDKSQPILLAEFNTHEAKNENK